MCIYYSHVAKLPSEIFTFILLDIGCSQPRPKKILSPVPLVRADTWNLLSAENKRLINTSSNSKVQGLWKNKNWRMGRGAPQCRHLDMTWLLHSWSLHKVKQAKTPGCVGGQCVLHAPPLTEAVGTWRMLKEGESFSLENIPLASFPWHWLAPCPCTYVLKGLNGV